MKHEYLKPKLEKEKLLTSDVIMSSGNGGQNLNDVAAGTNGEGGLSFGDI